MRAEVSQRPPPPRQGRRRASAQRPIAVVTANEAVRIGLTEALAKAGLHPYSPAQWPDASAHLLWLDLDGPDAALLTHTAAHCPVVVRLRVGATASALEGIRWDAVRAVVVDDPERASEVARAVSRQGARARVLPCGPPAVGEIGGEALALVDEVL